MIRFAPTAEPVASVIIVAWREAPLLLTCLESLADTVADVPYEVLLVLNEPSPGLTTQVDRMVAGAQVMKFRSNLGFGGAVNYAAEKARGEYLVLLNDDATVERGWLEALVDTARRRPRCGLVGGMFLHPDGTLQEAGSVLWSDGHTNAVGDGQPASFMRFERRVDYCSGGSLLIRADLWGELGGFDDRYYPAYYEDVDLSLRAAELGWQAWYQPLSAVRHVRSASAGRFRLFLDERSIREFRLRWADLLQNQPDKWDYECAIWEAMGRPVRVLWIDDHLADPSMGAGFPRMHDALGVITRNEGVHVDLYASEPAARSSADLVQMGVRVIPDLAAHLATDGVEYELAVVSRPNNFDAFHDLIRRSCPSAPLIYDAEALFYRRLEGQVELTADDAERDRLRSEAAKMQRLEESIFQSVDAVVCLSEIEADLVRGVTDAPVWVVEPWMEAPRPTEAGYGERRHIGLAAGWGAGAASPNCDGLLWFAHEVLPKVRAALPGWRLLVTGSDPPPDVAWLEGRTVEFVGHVQDLAAFYNRVRVVVSPTRYGAGVKIKTVEAIQYGVPIVATREAVGGLNQAVMDAVRVTDDADQFADAIIQLARDRDTWESARANALAASAATAKGGPHAERWLDVIRGTLRLTGGEEEVT